MILFGNAIGNFHKGGTFVTNEEKFVVVRPVRIIAVRRSRRRNSQLNEPSKARLTLNPLTVFVTRLDGCRALTRSYSVKADSTIAEWLRRLAKRQGVDRRSGMHFMNVAGTAQGVCGRYIDFTYDQNGVLELLSSKYLGLSISHKRTQ